MTELRPTNDLTDYDRVVVDQFRANGGRGGEGFEGVPLFLLHTVGARSGQARMHPVMYLADGERFLIFASNGGQDANPRWYWNLQAHPEATIELDGELIPVRAEELHGAERDEWYAEQGRRYARFAGYQAKTTRTIPVIALTRRDG